jgi:predicted deacylase
VTILNNTVFLLLIALAALQPAFAESFVVGDVEASRGHQASGYLVVSPGIDEGTKIPITIVHGAADGPVLALIAGTHGYEYPGITALQRVRKSLDPREVSGTIIMVHIANMPSFLGRTIYRSPVDGKNLNRMYPGDPEGSVSQRIAHVVTTEVMDRADYLIDLHAGDGNEALRPFVYMPVTGDTELDEASKGLAMAFGLDHIVVDKAPLRSSEDSVYTDQTALVRGIPAITTETGQLGLNDDYWVDMAEAGILNVLRHLEMISGDEIVNEGVTWLTDYEVIKSPGAGIFRADVRDGYHIAKGGKLGVLLDFFGEEIEEIRAPFAGVVNYVIATPPVSEGEPLAMISRIQAQ